MKKKILLGVLLLFIAVQPSSATMQEFHGADYCNVVIDQTPPMIEPGWSETTVIIMISAKGTMLNDIQVIVTLPAKVYQRVAFPYPANPELKQFEGYSSNTITRYGAVSFRVDIFITGKSLDPINVDIDYIVEGVQGRRGLNFDYHLKISEAWDQSFIEGAKYSFISAGWWLYVVVGAGIFGVWMLYRRHKHG